MARRKKPDAFDQAALLIKVLILGIALLALSIGGVHKFAPTFVAVTKGLLIGIALLAVVLAVIWIIFRAMRRGRPLEEDIRPPVLVKPNARWTVESIRTTLDKIDWYQFEKFCAALLRADGFKVAHTGGAHPDGGVDLIVEKENQRALIQCKHWRTWKVKESTVRELLGSMTNERVSQGAIYTLHGWTQPAAALAAQHDITLVNGNELARSALLQLPTAELNKLLDASVHHCPKCGALMKLREGNHASFWGCSRYPACHGKIKVHDSC